jgi:hypothetical protein
MSKKNIPNWQISAFDKVDNSRVKTKPINKKIKELEAAYLKGKETSVKVEDIDMSVFSLKDEPLKEEDNNHSDELDKYQEMRRLQREADLKKLREADTKVVFSKSIRQDPNRGMHFIKNLSSINQGKLGYSRTFLKGIKVETYY